MHEGRLKAALVENRLFGRFALCLCCGVGVGVVIVVIVILVISLPCDVLIYCDSPGRGFVCSMSQFYISSPTMVNA